MWAPYRDARLKEACIVLDTVVLILRRTISETELYIINALHSFVAEKWPASPLECVNDKIAVRYLGVEILWEPGAKSFSISQAAYIADILRAHNLHNAHSTLLPVPREWVEAAEAELEDVEADISESVLRSAQRAFGEALWLATKSRPDILFVANHMASVVSKRPAYVLRVSHRVLSYLSGTSNLKLMLGPRSDIPGELVCFTDASYAPFGQRSFGAAVVTLEGSPVAWKAGRQSFVTLSVMEAELYAAIQGCVLLESVSSVLEEVCPGNYSKVLAIDNKSAVAMCSGGPGSQRTRHLKIRASYIRESVSEGRLTIRHTPGDLQLADLATKLQPKVRLWRLLTLWGFVGDRLTEMLNAFKAKLLSVVVVLSALLVPVTGTPTEKKALGSDRLGRVGVPAFTDMCSSDWRLGGPKGWIQGSEKGPEGLKEGPKDEACVRPGLGCCFERGGVASGNESCF